MRTSPPPSDKPQTLVHVELNARTALVGVLTVAGVWLLLQIWQILIVVVVGLMFVGMLNPAIEWLRGRGLGRGRAVAVVFVGLLLLVVAFAVLTLPQLVGQISDVAEHFPEMQQKAVHLLQENKLTSPVSGYVASLRPQEIGDKAKEYGLHYGPHAVEIVAYAASAAFLAFYIIIDRDRLRGSLFALVPRSHHVRASRVLMNLETIVGGYMRGQAITSALMTAFTFIVLTIAGVPNALALSLFAGVADVLPYVGALLACLPAFFAALPQGMTVALVVLAILGAYQEFESRVIVPRVYGRVLRLPAATIMVALLVGGKLLGVLGALLALPIAAGIRMMVAELRLELPGEDVDDTDLRAKDAAAEAEFEARAAGLPAIAAASIASEIAAAREESPKKNGELAPLTSGHD